MRTISFDGVIVGGGGAGMRAALQFSPTHRMKATQGHVQAANADLVAASKDSFSRGRVRAVHATQASDRHGLMPIRNNCLRLPLLFRVCFRDSEQLLN